MNKFVTYFLFLLLGATQSHASLLDQLLNDEGLDGILCNDLNYDKTLEMYNLTLTIGRDVKTKKITEATLNQNYGQQLVIINQVEASADLKTFKFLDYTLELTEEQFFKNHQFRSTLKKSNVEMAELVCGFSILSSGS